MRDEGELTELKADEVELTELNSDEGELPELKADERKVITYKGSQYQYRGHVDRNGHATGWGSFEDK